MIAVQKRNEKKTILQKSDLSKINWTFQVIWFGSVVHDIFSLIRTSKSQFCISVCIFGVVFSLSQSPLPLFLSFENENYQSRTKIRSIYWQPRKHLLITHIHLDLIVCHFDLVVASIAFADTVSTLASINRTLKYHWLTNTN